MRRANFPLARDTETVYCRQETRRAARTNLAAQQQSDGASTTVPHYTASRYARRMIPALKY